MRIVWIRNDLYEQIISLVKDYLPYETGGMLLGYTDVRGNLVVTKVVGPGPDAVHQKDYFLPDAIYQQEEINRAFKDSEGETTYLGDWHSHPFQPPYMSKLDLKTLKRIALHKLSGTVEPIFLIVGTHPVIPKCWKFERSIIKTKEVNIRFYNL